MNVDSTITLIQFALQRKSLIELVIIGVDTDVGGGDRLIF